MIRIQTIYVYMCTRTNIFARTDVCLIIYISVHVYHDGPIIYFKVSNYVNILDFEQH